MQSSCLLSRDWRRLSCAKEKNSGVENAPTSKYSTHPAHAWTKCLYARSRTIVLNTSRDLIFPSSWRIFGHVSALDQSCASENIWWITRSDICPWASVCWRQCTTKTNKHPIQAKKFWKMELHREPRSPVLHDQEKIRFLRRRVLYFPEGTESFNPVMIEIILCADVHPHRGPNSKQKQKLSASARSQGKPFNRVRDRPTCEFEAHSFPRTSLSENCSLQSEQIMSTDNYSNLLFNKL